MQREGGFRVQAVCWSLLLLLGLGCNAPTRVALPVLATAVPRAPVSSSAGEATAVPPPAATEPALTRPEPAPDVTPWRVAISPGVPGEVAVAVGQLTRERPAQFVAGELATADVVLTPGEGVPLVDWYFVAVGPFATVEDEVSEAELQAAWEGAGERPLYASPSSVAALRGLWGDPAEAVARPAEALSAALWADRPAWGVVPFHRLTPELKLLAVEGHYPGRPGLARAYPLRVTIGLSGNDEAAAALQAAWIGPTTNRDEERLTRVAMTGVTALVRATAFEMERRGITWPGEEVAPVLREADIAHISNEVAFTADCPPPNPIGGTSFCSHDRYFPLLEMVGTDVVELTGNHVNDKGATYLNHTIDLYEAAGMATYGGGRDAASGAKPALFTHNGNRIAFVGCNPVGPAYAWATADAPGSRPCNFPDFYDEIAQLRAEGHIVIATLQYWEHYAYAPTPQQVIDFQALAEAGAAAVSGSQGHHAMGFSFHNGAFIHYGLGNLFFDQMQMMGTRQTFVDIYTIYEGRLLGVELWTGLIENFARPRRMTPAERESLLRAAFAASNWP